LKVVREFDPDIVHITRPSDVGQLGLAIAHRLHIPLAASWHTNVHQYAEQRGSAVLSFFPAGWGKRVGASDRAACSRFFASIMLPRSCLLRIRN
jgi:phosphatidylinositol alpha 1,6-mannosyltransferase